MYVPITLPRSQEERNVGVEKRIDRYDQDYVREVVRNINEKGITRLLFTKYNIYGRENAQSIQNRQVLMVGSHSSMSDYLFIGHFIADQITTDPQYFPRIIAGTNLYKTRLKNLWERFGAIDVDRGDKRNSYLRELRRFNQATLSEGKSILVYPEEGRNVSPKLKPFKSMIFGQVLEDLQETPDKDILLVPLHTAYDTNPDLRFINQAWLLKKGRDWASKKGFQIMSKIFDYSYFGLDLASYGIRWFEGKLDLKRRGEAHMYFGQPLSIRDEIVSKGKGKRDLAELAQREVQRLKDLRVP
jgi:hypothetical protein